MMPGLTIDLELTLPVLTPLVGAVLILLLDLVVPRAQRVHAAIGLVATLFGAGAAINLVVDHSRAETFCPDGVPGCLYEVGAVGAGLQTVALIATGVVIALLWPVLGRYPQGRGAVVVALLLVSTAGTTGAVAANDLVSLLTCLELATLPAIGLIALRGKEGGRRSLDGSLSLLTTSLVSFAFMALGAALWFAATGSVMLSDYGVIVADGDPALRTLLVLALVFFVVGVGFKLSLVPFHAWTPLAFSGASLPVAAFLATTSKVAALGALVSVLMAVTPLGAPTLVAAAVPAAISLIVGPLMALREQDPVRFLAWSTVTQAGWVVLPLATLREDAPVAAATMLLIAVMASLLAFTVLAVWLRTDRYLAPIRAQSGMFVRRPVSATLLCLALLTLAGLPPSIVGMTGKIVVLRPVLDAQGWWMVVVAAVGIVLALAAYVRWIFAMTGTGDGDGSPSGTGLRAWHPFHAVVLVVLTLALVATSVMPGLVLWLAGAE